MEQSWTAPWEFPGGSGNATRGSPLVRPCSSCGRWRAAEMLGIRALGYCAVRAVSFVFPDARQRLACNPCAPPPPVALPITAYLRSAYSFAE